MNAFHHILFAMFLVMASVFVCSAFQWQAMQQRQIASAARRTLESYVRTTGGNVSPAFVCKEK
jgi:hypothetical protein